MSKKLENVAESPHRESLKRCLKSRKKYRAEYHSKNLEEQRRKNRQRYHEKYKKNPGYQTKAAQRWAEYVKRKGPEWVLERSRKYRKLNGKEYYSQPKVREKMRANYNKWAKQNWEKRVEYARRYRRKVKPQIAIREAVDEARRTGDLRKLADACVSAIVRLNELGHKRHDKS
mgnify:CR=1 FL=1